MYKLHLYLFRAIRGRDPLGVTATAVDRSVTGILVPVKMVLGPKFSKKILVPADQFFRKNMVPL